MRKIKIVSVVGARPNFMKIAPLLREFEKRKDILNILVNTGQHYTGYMSDIFLKDFNIKKHTDLNVGADTPIRQIARVMTRFEKVLIKEKPDAVVVVGDVNSTLACALTAVKLNIKVAHVEAGLRSFDRTMPEEINRVLTDSISDYLFATEPSALRNLKREGISGGKVFFVGNIMIDSLIHSISEARKRNIRRKFGLQEKGYALLTLHRPSNVDDKKQLSKTMDMLGKVKEKVKIVYPIHPRSVKMLKHFKYWERLNSEKNIIAIKPLGYIDFLSLMMGAKFVITDSGGIQEETTYLGIPCFTLRKNTERPVTVTRGTNKIIGHNYGLLLKSINRMPSRPKRKIPALWDGRTAKRIAVILRKGLKKAIAGRRREGA